MLSPKAKHLEALQKMQQLNPLYFDVIIDYLTSARDHERDELEQCLRQDTETQKGKCKMMSEVIMTFKSLAPKKR
jgi:hypothetical protein